MKTEKEVFLKEFDWWVERGTMEKRIRTKEPWYRLTPAGQRAAREIGMPYLDGEWRCGHAPVPHISPDVRHAKIEIKAWMSRNLREWSIRRQIPGCLRHPERGRGGC